MRHAGLVIPVHDEVELLPRCLSAVRAAAKTAGVAVHVVVVLDRCTDGSAAILAAERPLGHSTHVVRIDAANVGAARAAGCAALLQRYDVGGLWLATTDADSAVGPTWLRQQLRYASSGYDAVAGTVTIDDWTSYREESQRAYRRGYRRRWGHRHVHGANLGFSADAYVDAGGFAALPTGEDVALVAALTGAGRRIAWADDVPVMTSSRRLGRSPGGMSRFLSALPAAPL